MRLNSTKQQNSGLIQIESLYFTDDKMKLAKMMIFVFDWTENIVGKGQNSGYQHFVLFPKCFKGLLLWVVESLDCVVKNSYPCQCLDTQAI